MLVVLHKKCKGVAELVSPSEGWLCHQCGAVIPYQESRSELDPKNIPKSIVQDPPYILENYVSVLEESDGNRAGVPCRGENDTGDEDPDRDDCGPDGQPHPP